MKELCLATDLSHHVTKETAHTIDCSMTDLTTVILSRNLWERGSDASLFRPLRGDSFEGKWSTHHKVCPPLCGALRKSVYYPWHPRGAAVPARPLLSVYSIPKPIMALGGLPPLRSVTEKRIQLFPAGHPFQGTNTLLREY